MAATRRGPRKKTGRKKSSTKKTTTTAAQPEPEQAPPPRQPSKFGIRLIQGSSYSVDGKRFIRHRVYAVDRGLRDRLVGGRAFADAVVAEGQQAHLPDEQGKLPHRGLTVGQRKEMAIDNRDERLRKRKDLSDQSQIGDRMDPQPAPHVAKLIGDEMLELDPVEPIPLTGDGTGGGAQGLAPGDYEDE